MAVQDSFGRLTVFEDFLTLFEDTDTAIVDADGLRHNDVLIIAVSGDVAMNSTVDEPNGVAQFSGAGGAGDGIVISTSPLRPDRNGTIVTGGRAKMASITDGRFFAGFMSTMDRDESLIPFTLSGTTLTANNSGEAVGFYVDFGATTDDMRFMSSTAGAADTTAAVINHVNGTTTTLGSLGVRANATLAADKYFVWRVEMDNDGTVRGYFGDESMLVKGPKLIATLKAGTMTTTALYFPACAITSTSTGDPLFEVDYFHASGARYWGA